MKKKYVVVISLIGVLSLLLVFKNEKDEILVKDDINIKNTIAMYKSDDKTNYAEIEEMPSEGYIVNEEKSYCTTDNKTEVKGKVKTIDGNIVITNMNKNDKCYVWFDRLDDEKPIINNVATSVTKTEITVTVTATDNIGVTEYWYQIDSNEPIKGTGNTHQFTGLTAGTIYSVKVYVKDAVGNQSDTTEKSVTTTKPTGSETILASANKGSGTPDFSKTSCSNGCEEATVGTYTVADPIYNGITTYFRGDVSDNYVKFARFCWRIIRINGDGTIRLIYDGTTCHTNGTSTSESIAKTSTKYNNSANQPYYVGWTYGTSQRPSPSTGGTNSNAKTQLQSWYDSNLNSYDSNIADGIYCNDREVQAGSSYGSSAFNYVAYKRIITDHTPSLECNESDRYTLKVGLITVDEVMYAGGRDTNNISYYLYNGQNYWTMSPGRWRGLNGGSHVFSVQSNGDLDGGATVVLVNHGIRPVINLRSDVTFSSGNGTQSNPYVVS